MNRKDILNYVDMQGSTVKEVFSSILENNNGKAKEAASAVAKKYIEQVNTELVGNKAAYARKNKIEYVMAQVEEWSFKEAKSWRTKLFVKPFLGIHIKLYCYVFGFNEKKLTEIIKEKEKAYYELGDAIFLAGLYELVGK